MALVRPDPLGAVFEEPDPINVGAGARPFRDQAGHLLLRPRAGAVHRRDQEPAVPVGRGTRDRAPDLELADETEPLTAEVIDRELDETRRKDLVRKAEAIFEQDPPLLPVSWEKINDGWFNYVKGHNPYKYFGIYDVVRFDTFWLDK